MDNVQLLGQNQASQLKRKNISEWFYLPSWKRSHILGEVNIDIFKHQKFLVFSDRSDFIFSLINWLQANNLDVAVVENNIVHNPSNSYVLDPLKKESFINFFEILNQRKELPAHIIYSPLGNLDPKKYFLQLICLAQSIGEVCWNKDITISLISQDIQKIIGSETIQPEKSLLIGPCKVINKEIENINCKLIDIESNIDYVKHNDLFSQIISDIMLPNRSLHVAYRGMYRWLPTYQNICIPKNNTCQSLLKKEGCYLITGGLGGIGLAIAEHLGRKWDAKLILISRRKLPSKSKWDEDTNSSLSDIKAIKILKKLKEMGIEYLVLQADVSNLEQMEEVFRISYSVFPEINGIIHAAGVSGGGLMQLRTFEQFNAVMAPKVDGILVFEKLLQKISIDFFIACSSLSAMLGEIGQADYCAANCFLDSAIHRIKDTLGIQAISINWGRWSEVGMAVNENLEKETDDSCASSLSNEWITTIEGLEAFERVLSNPISQVVVSPYDIRHLIKLEEDRS